MFNFDPFTYLVLHGAPAEVAQILRGWHGALRRAGATRRAVPSVKGVACIYLPVADVYAAAHWYMQNFGMTCSPNTPLKGSMQHAILNYPAQGPSLFLVARDPDSTPARRRDGEDWLSLCFMVEDIQALFHHLRASGVRLESDTPVDRGSCGRNLRFYDPDGNRLELVQA